jgi:hypothetical protein
VIIYAIKAFKAKEPTKKIYLRIIIVLTAIITNFPVAWACFNCAWYIRTLYVLTIENRSSATIQQVTISGCGITRNVGPILPNGKNPVKFHNAATNWDGLLIFSASSNGLKIDGILKENVTPGFGAKITLVIKDGGKYEIEDHPPLVD